MFNTKSELKLYNHGNNSKKENIDELDGGRSNQQKPVEDVDGTRTAWKSLRL